MPLKDFDLREVYSVEYALNAETVRKYFSMGKEGLLAYCARNPIQIEIAPLWRETTITDGNHRAKALLKHSVYIMACEFTTVWSEPMSWDVVPIKLVNTPEVEDEEYQRYQESLWKFT